MKNFRSGVSFLLFLILITAASMPGGEPSQRPIGLPPGAEWATEETFLDKAAGIKQFAEGYQLADGTTKRPIRVGEWKFSTPGVSMFRTEVYNEKGVNHGPKILYTGPGRPQLIVNYVNGVMEGKSQTFHPISGALVREAEYKAGLLNGFVTVYSSEGKVVSRVKFVNGEPQE
jgi:hypothetical protein